MIKDSEIAAGSLGIHAPRYKVIAFADQRASTRAIAGGLFAYLVRYINPESFSVGLSISFLSMVVIGGLGTIGGSIVGARSMSSFPNCCAASRMRRAWCSGCCWWW